MAKVHQLANSWCYWSNWTEYRDNWAGSKQVDMNRAGYSWNSHIYNWRPFAEEAGDLGAPYKPATISKRVYPRTGLPLKQNSLEMKVLESSLCKAGLALPTHILRAMGCSSPVTWENNLFSYAIFITNFLTLLQGAQGSICSSSPLYSHNNPMK